jgi:putative DNA methylase
MTEIRTPKKLIEVALPLDDINAAAAGEKAIRHGHPSNLHRWWARRPLAAARAVLFAQMVNDPGDVLEGDRRTKEFKQRVAAERERLFQIIRELVQWENTNNEEVLNQARAEIRKSWKHICELNKNHPEAAELFNPEKLPAFHDPFAGGGAIPLEAQRLGLESYASDLNPVAVMINKAMIEIPPKFAGRVPVGPIVEGRMPSLPGEEWPGATGLAEDVRRYGHWMREEAFKRIGHLYPKVKITQEMVEGKDALAPRPDLAQYVGQELTVIAWLWARTVKSPNPAFSHVDVPLVRSFVLSSKKGKEAWVEPVIEGDSYRFVVRTGKQPKDALAGTVVRTGGTCLMSGTAMPFPYIRDEGKASRMGAKLMAVVAEGKGGRIYLSPTVEMEQIAQSAQPENVPESQLPEKALGFRVQEYGMLKHRDLFTPRQLVALTTFSDLVQEARAKVIADARAVGLEDDGLGLNDGGSGATAYGDAVAVYLGFILSKTSDSLNSLCPWEPVAQCSRQLFGRQAIPMVWDFAEGNMIGTSSGSFLVNIRGVISSLNTFSVTQHTGTSIQKNAGSQAISQTKVVSSDPPYYDNIGYADLSDFFYVWLRRSLRSIYPNLFATMAVPKAEELVATPYRHGNKEKAEQFFLDGMGKAIHNLAEQAHAAFPITIYYAFKASETSDSGTGNTGWETFLQAIINAGFLLVGTWPLRTELNAALKTKINSLASADTISRRDFQRQLRNEMPEALEAMIGRTTGQSPIAPVDLAQAAIGPGMAIYSQYEAVLNQDGTPMSVHEALILINREITDYLTPDAGNFDSYTLFCSDWFNQYGWKSGPFGEAEVLAKAKGTSVDGVKESGVIESGSGKVRLFGWKEYPDNWNPEAEKRMPVWEALHHLIRQLKEGGESAAGSLLARIPDKGEPVRQLAYHLYTLCERQGWAEDARSYNELIGSWHAIVAESNHAGHADSQGNLFGGQ